MIKVGEFVVSPTIFPDGTSQVWKIPDLALLTSGPIIIQWDFENESELVHVAQLATLLDVKSRAAFIELYVPFLPYGRQDKSVDNESTFALETFARLMAASGVDLIRTIDAHNPSFSFSPIGLLNESAEPYINRAIDQFGANSVCFPDLGASDRYANLCSGLGSIVLRKARNQVSGEITGMEVCESGHEGGKILIVDDICDGGRTFIEAAKLLKETHNPEQIGLYVTHGIFSRGTQPLRDAGIERLFTHKGEVL